MKKLIYIFFALLLSNGISYAGGYKCSFIGYTASSQLVIVQGRNDGINRLYASGTYPYEYSWDGFSWIKDTLAEQSCYSKAITAGYGRSDSICRIYTGGYYQKDINEFSYNGSSWDSAKVKIGNGYNIRCVDIGNIKNDDTMRLVAGCEDSTTIAYTYEEGSGIWTADTLGIKRSIVLDVAIGKGRNDDTNRVYSFGGIGAIEYSYRNDWDTTVHVPGFETSHVLIGDAKNDGVNRLYVSRSGNGLYEYVWDGSAWLLSDVVDTTIADWAVIGNGRNDGKKRIYALGYSMALGDTMSDIYVFEYSHNGSSWTKDTLDTIAYNFGYNFLMISVVVGDVRNDGKNRIYALSDLGHLFEWEWDDSLNGVSTEPVYSDKVYSLSLGQNYPNPFNKSTVISFQLPVNGQVNLSIYNVAGQLVRDLTPSPLQINLERGVMEGSVTWDGRDSRGQPVNNGLYFYCLEAGGIRRTKRMILLK